MLRTILICLVLVLAALAVYGPTVRFGYIDFDDSEYVRDNGLVRAGLTWNGARWAFTTGYDSNWHPLTWLSLMIDAQVWGAERPGGFHVTNLLVHIASALLLLGVLRAMTGDFWPSAMVAGVFALHPIHVESVAWIAERKDVLCGLFWMLSLWAYLLYVRQPGASRYALVMLAFALGLMCKSMMVSLPGVLLLLDYWPLRRGFGRSSSDRNPKSKIENPKSLSALLIEKLPLILMALAASLATWLVQRPGGTLEEGAWIPMTQRLSNAAFSYVRYLGKMLWPHDLAILYPNPNLIGKTWPVWTLAGSVMILIAITIAAILLRRTRPYLIVGWLWFLGVMLPASGLVQFGRQSMADRYAYLPLIGVYVAIVWSVADALRRLPWRGWLAAPLMAGILAALAFSARAQTALWKESQTVFQHALEVTRDNWVMHRNLAGVLEASGDVDAALSHMDQAVHIFPQCAWLRDHYGLMLLRHDRLYDAQRQFALAVQLDPNSAQAHFDLAVALVKRRQFDQAQVQLDIARALNPGEKARYDEVQRQIRIRGVRESTTAPRRELPPPNKTDGDASAAPGAKP